jgi:hypothetical protein
LRAILPYIPSINYTWIGISKLQDFGKSLTMHYFIRDGG